MGRRVLIADGNLDSAESLADLLEMSGHTTMSANTGPDALALASSFRPEVVFLALHLPWLSGYDVCRKLCSGEHGPRPILLIALTGDGSESHRQASLDAGFDHHLVKPASPSELLSLLSYESPQGGSPSHLLIASDDDSVRPFLTKVLVKAGYRVTEVRNGTAAVAALLSNKTDFALALFDGQRPPISATRTIAALREAGCELPVILASGSCVVSDLPVSDSRVALLSKPFRVEELLETVAALLAR